MASSSRGSRRSSRRRGATDALARCAAGLLAACAVAIPAAAAKSATLVAPPPAHTFGIRRVSAKELGIFLPGIQIRSPGAIATALLEATDGADRGDDDEVTIVALDSATGNVFTNFGLLRVETWTGAGTEIGALRNPTGVAIDRAGRVCVTDTGNKRVALLQHDGNELRAVRAFDGFLEPTGVAPDGRGGFWVCDRRANAVFHLDTATGERTTFGLEVGFDRPIACATIPQGETMPSGTKRALVVVDQDGQRLRSFDPTGVFRASIEAASLANGAGASFDAIDLDYYGNVYAVDRAGDRLHKLRHDLLPLDTFGGRGEAEGQFLSPRGIAIHRKLGQVFVTEEGGGQYLWVGTDVKDFRADDQGDEVAFSFLLTEESTVDVRILDVRGEEVSVLSSGSRYPAGPQRGTWDGTDENGKRVRGGDYLAEIRARATYASRSTYEKKLLRTFTLGRSSSP